VCDPLPSSPGNTSPVGVVQILPDSKPVTKPTKPQRNFAVRYEPRPSDAAANDGPSTKQTYSVSSENMAMSTTRPVPRPRARSMVQSSSEPVNISDIKSDKLVAPGRPAPATRPIPPVIKPPVLRPSALKGPRGCHTVSSSIWYDGVNSVPPQRPPPVKPKPFAMPASSKADKTAEHVSTEIPSDVSRQKPTIIRSALSAEHGIGQTVSNTVLPVPTQTTVNSSTASSSVPSGAETNGWNKSFSHTQQSGSNTAGDVVVQPVAEGTKPQPKKRPTIIRPVPSDSECANDSSGAPSSEKQPPQTSSVEVLNGSSVRGWESHNVAVAGLQPSVAEPSKQPVSLESENHRLKPVPLSQLQPIHIVEQDLDSKVPPAKPPPPKTQNAEPVHGIESHNAVVTELQPSGDHGSSVMPSKQPVSLESESHDLKPVPRSQSQPIHTAEQDLDNKVPPAKPPPPKTQNTEPEQNTTV